MDFDYLLDPDYLKIITTIILAVLGWLVANYLTNRRNIVQRKKELTVKHLINAYRILTNEISGRELNPERLRKLGDVLSDIQLFGSSEQIRIVKDLTNTVAKGDTYDLDLLINSLRKDLRAELKLTEVEGNVHWLRFRSDNKT